MKQLASVSFVCLWGGTSGSNIIVPEAYWYGLMTGCKNSNAINWNEEYRTFMDLTTTASKGITETGVSLSRYSGSGNNTSYRINSLPHLTFSKPGVYYMSVEFSSECARTDFDSRYAFNANANSFRNVGLWYNRSSWGKNEGIPVGPYRFSYVYSGGSDIDLTKNKYDMLLDDIIEGEVLTFWTHTPINVKASIWNNSNSSSYCYTLSGFASMGLGGFGHDTDSSTSSTQFIQSPVISISIEKIK